MAMEMPLMVALLFFAKIDFYMSKNMRYGKTLYSFLVYKMHTIMVYAYIRLSLIKLHNH